MILRELVMWGIIVAAVSAASAASAPEFARDVLPILQTRCASCHAGDKHEGGLRLDSVAALLRGGDNYSPAIIPGKSADSPLFQFVSREDADLVMPPKGDRLSPQEVETLKRWIDEGSFATDEAEPTVADAGPPHWSYGPVVRRPLPAFHPAEQAEGYVDAWLLAALHAKNLTFQPEADARTLVRRLFFDLVGLPPSLTDIANFEAASQSDRYERLVDRLLASPRFGERWARHWLDVVRFAETNGFEMNQPRLRAWPYRDYVIDSANSDKPFADFVREQIAGDTLGVDEATGFLVGGPWDQVKSPDPVLTAQQRADELHDMVSTTGSAFLGLTVGCARCHRHKFDPISQTDYYRLKAAFEGVKHGERPALSTASSDQQRQAQRDAWKSELRVKESQVRKANPLARAGRIVWLDGPASTDGSTPITTWIKPTGEMPYQPGSKPGQTGFMGQSGLFPTPPTKFRFWRVESEKPVLTWRPGLQGTFRVWLSWGGGRSTHSPDARLSLDRDGNLDTDEDRSVLGEIDQRSLADGTTPTAEAPIWSGLKPLGVVTVDPSHVFALSAPTKKTTLTASALCLEEVVDDTNMSPIPSARSPVRASGQVERFSPRPARLVRMTIFKTNSAEPCLDEIEVYPANEPTRNIAAASEGAQVSASSTFAGSPIHQLAHLNDGKYGNEWSWISAEPGRGEVTVAWKDEVVIDTVVWGRDQTSPPQFTDRLATEYLIETSRDGKTWEAAASHVDRLPTEAAFSLYSIERARSLPDDDSLWSTTVDRIQELRKSVRDAETGPMVYAGLFESPGPTMRLHRGDAMAPREVVAPGALTQIGPPAPALSDQSEAARRLALAQWISEPDHPLTWRVISNRLWLQHFGEGIVSTPSDFGRNGAPPSHLELLDALVVDLAEHEFRLKHLHRTMVTSRAYRQSSIAHETGLAVDAGSRLLWRFPPRRLDAEPLRDTILAVAGNLDLSMGGAGFSLFEPNDNYVRVYKSRQTFGPAEWRRMVYQTKVRMQLDDTFGAFDCPDAGQIAPKRSRSITPLQALNLLHSAFILEEARLLVERVEREVPSSKENQIDRIFELSLQRLPDPVERAAALQLVESEGMRSLARALFNANEFLMID